VAAPMGHSSPSGSETISGAGGERAWQLFCIASSLARRPCEERRMSDTAKAMDRDGMAPELMPAEHAPKTEEEIQAVTIGQIAPLTSPIVIAEYDPEWPRLFQREAERIRAALGARVVLLEHAGSTSVPGLAAKPIIDILLVVPNSADEPSYVPSLEAAGYVL